MAAVNFNIYDAFRKVQWEGTGINFTTATIKCAIVTSAYTVDQNLHNAYDDVSANEVSGTNYTAGGNTLASPTVALDGAGDVTITTSDPATWSQHASGFSDGRFAIIYADSGTPSTSLLIGYSDTFGSDKGNVDGDFDVDVTASTLMTQAR